MRALSLFVVGSVLFCTPVFAQFGGSTSGRDERPKKPLTVMLSTKDAIQQVIPQIAPDLTSSDAHSKALFARLLSQTTSVSFQEIPLRDAVKQLAAETELDIHIDEYALEEYGLDSSVKVSLALNDVSVYSALKWMLAQNDLTFMIDVDRIVVTGSDQAERQLVNRFYAIPNLIGNPAYHDILIEVITTTVEPDSWEELGGPGSVCPYLNGLMISTTEEIHTKLDRLLVGLHQLQAFPSNPYPTASYRVSLFPKQEQKILSELQSKIAQFAPEKMSLKTFVEQFRKHTSCPVHIDQRALEDLGYNQDDVTVIPPAKSTSLKRILDISTRSFADDLRWFVAGDLIVVTTKEEADGELGIEIYPVRDLAWKGIDITNPKIEAQLLKDPWENDSIVSLPDYEAMVTLLVTTIKPDSWEELGGPGSVGIYDNRCDCLVITQTESVHMQIQAALAQIREQQQPIDVDKLLADIEKHESTIFTQTYSALRQTADTPLLTREEMQRMAERIKQQFAPESWSDDSVFIESLGDVLVIRQRRDVHRQIEKFLQERSIIPPHQIISGSGCMMFPSNQSYLPPQQEGNSSAQPTPAVPQAKAPGGGGVF